MPSATTARLGQGNATTLDATWSNAPDAEIRRLPASASNEEVPIYLRWQRAGGDNRVVDAERAKRKYAGFVPLVGIFGGAAAGGAVAQALGWPPIALMAPGFAGGYIASRHLINSWFAPDE